MINLALRKESLERNKHFNETIDNNRDFVFFRDVFSLMDAMKVDMANFQLQTIKPHLVQQSAEFERKKFKDYLETNPGTNSLF